MSYGVSGCTLVTELWEGWQSGCSGVERKRLASTGQPSCDRIRSVCVARHATAAVLILVARYVSASGHGQK